MMSTLDLDASYLSQLYAVLEKYAPGMEVWAYGSRVKGGNHDASDLDLVIRDPNQLTQPFANLVELKQAFSDSDIPILVDVVDWARIPQTFQQEILKHFVKL